MIVKRRCINSVSTEAFEILVRGEMSESGDNFWGDLWDDPCGVPDCFSGAGTCACGASVVTEVCDGLSFGSDWVEPQSFSLTKKGCSLLEV